MQGNNEFLTKYTCLCGESEFFEVRQTNEEHNCLKCGRVFKVPHPAPPPHGPLWNIPHFGTLEDYRNRERVLLEYSAAVKAKDTNPELFKDILRMLAVIKDFQNISVAAEPKRKVVHEMKVLSDAEKRKLNELIDVVVQTILDSLGTDKQIILEHARRLNFRDLFKVLKDSKEIVEVVDAAVLNALFKHLLLSVRADGNTSEDEVFVVASIISVCSKRLKHLSASWDEADSDIDELAALKFLNKWQSSPYIFGGMYKGDANLISLMTIASRIANNTSCAFGVYRHCMQIAMRLVMQTEGVTAVEQRLLDDISQELCNAERSLSAVLRAESTHQVCQQPEATQSEDSIEIPQTTSINTPSPGLRESHVELDRLIGLSSVKCEVNRLENLLKIRAERIKQELSVVSHALHFVFTGNPGTGKTTVARILAKMLFELGVLKSQKLVETSRSGLVAGYVGQTALKTTAVVNNAMDGVLFIDEAYSLTSSGENDFGSESIEVLLKMMEDNRDRLVVIVAGYPDEMHKFINSNPGLASRFTRYLHFEDYSIKDLCRIFDAISEIENYSLTPMARGALAIIFALCVASKNKSFGNGRFVRNAFELAVGNHANRLAISNEPLTREALSTLDAADMPKQLLGALSLKVNLLTTKWKAKCPRCGRGALAGIKNLGQVIECSCSCRYRFPWWNLAFSENQSAADYFATSEHDLIGELVP